MSNCMFLELGGNLDANRYMNILSSGRQEIYRRDIQLEERSLGGSHGQRAGVVLVKPVQTQIEVFKADIILDTPSMAHAVLHKSNAPADEIATLKALVQSLTEENAMLKQDNTMLKQELAAVQREKGSLLRS